MGSNIAQVLSDSRVSQRYSSATNCSPRHKSRSPGRASNVAHQLASNYFFRYRSTVLANTLNSRYISRRANLLLPHPANCFHLVRVQLARRPRVSPSARALSRPTTVRRREASNSWSETQAMKRNGVSARKASGVPGSAANREAQGSLRGGEGPYLDSPDPQIPFRVRRVHPPLASSARMLSRAQPARTRRSTRRSRFLSSGYLTETRP